MKHVCYKGDLDREAMRNRIFLEIDAIRPPFRLVFCKDEQVFIYERVARIKTKDRTVMNNTAPLCQHEILEPIDDELVCRQCGRVWRCGTQSIEPGLYHITGE